ncbi:hypothetical protein AGMMS49921_12510 [Endomicrobiia bacterium]|nr:hypothetical protein AGMMS49921_12510 [Endomicrobiia bacterium]
MTIRVKAVTRTNSTYKVAWLKKLEEELLKNKKVREILDKTGKTTLGKLSKDNLDKAYRALSKKYLPDKHNNESNEEKERAAEDFKELEIMLIRC